MPTNKGALIQATHKQALKEYENGNFTKANSLFEKILPTGEIEDLLKEDLPASKTQRNIAYNFGIVCLNLFNKNNKLKDLLKAEKSFKLAKKYEPKKNNDWADSTWLIKLRYLQTLSKKLIHSLTHNIKRQIDTDELGLITTKILEECRTFLNTKPQHTTYKDNEKIDDLFSFLSDQIDSLCDIAEKTSDRKIELFCNLSAISLIDLEIDNSNRKFKNKLSNHKADILYNIGLIYEADNNYSLALQQMKNAKFIYDLLGETESALITNNYIQDLEKHNSHRLNIDLNAEGSDTESIVDEEETNFGNVSVPQSPVCTVNTGNEPLVIMHNDHAIQDLTLTSNLNANLDTPPEPSSQHGTKRKNRGEDEALIAEILSTMPDFGGTNSTSNFDASNLNQKTLEEMDLIELQRLNKRIHHQHQSENRNEILSRSSAIDLQLSIDQLQNNYSLLMNYNVLYKEEKNQLKDIETFIREINNAPNNLQHISEFYENNHKDLENKNELLIKMIRYATAKQSLINLILSDIALYRNLDQIFQGFHQIKNQLEAYYPDI